MENALWPYKVESTCNTRLGEKKRKNKVTLKNKDWNYHEPEELCWEVLRLYIISPIVGNMASAGTDAALCVTSSKTVQPSVQCWMWNVFWEASVSCFRVAEHPCLHFLSVPSAWGGWMPCACTVSCNNWIFSGLEIPRRSKFLVEGSRTLVIWHAIEFIL